MGKQSRTKRERREQVAFAASLTACAGTWLEQPPTREEQARIDAARQELKQHRALAESLAADEAINRFSIEIFQDGRFAPLHFDDWMIEAVLDEHGEPPIAADDNDTAFADYLRVATQTAATPRVRRALADQSRRFLPQYVADGQIKEALAIEHNAYMTVMSDANTPLLVQMLVGGLARWYEEHEDE